MIEIETDSAIYFHGNDPIRKYAAFSNFFPVKIRDPMSNRQFSCSEQYFMYYKCYTFEPQNHFLMNTIMEECNPKEIKKLGRLVKMSNVKLWDSKRLEVMRNALILKFTQNAHLGELLLSTGDKVIYEASRVDKIWGIGYDADTAVHVSPDRYGMNLLGLMLMEVRSYLKTLT